MMPRLLIEVEKEWSIQQMVTQQNIHTQKNEDEPYLIPHINYLNKKTKGHKTLRKIHR
jgi:hypothetical protein